MFTESDVVSERAVHHVLCLRRMPCRCSETGCDVCRHWRAVDAPCRRACLLSRTELGTASCTQVAPETSSTSETGRPSCAFQDVLRLRSAKDQTKISTSKKTDPAWSGLQGFGMVRGASQELLRFLPWVPGEGVDR